MCKVRKAQRKKEILVGHSNEERKKERKNREKNSSNNIYFYLELLLNVRNNTPILYFYK